MLVFLLLLCTTSRFIESIKVCPTYKDYYTYRFNENCYENPDGDADNPGEIIERWGLHYKAYNVTTPDGYKIGVYKLYGEIQHKTPIIIGHGILQNIMAYIDTGNRSLAYLLADYGYVVWLINWRGGRFSRGHVSLKDTHKDFWKMGFHEMAVFDLKTVLDLIYEETRKPGIYIGMSMGTTISIIYNIKEQKLANKRLKNMIHVTPITKMEHTKSLLKYMAYFWPFVKPIAWKISNGEFLPYTRNKRNYFCSLYPFTKKICDIFFWPIFGINVKEAPLFYPVISRQNKDSVSGGAVDHYAQMILSKKFREYDYGRAENLNRYQQVKPPIYDLNKLTVRQTIFVGRRDVLSTIKDADIFYDNLPKKLKCGYYEVVNYSHRDFVRAENVVEDFYDNLLRVISELDSGKCLQ